MTYSPRILVRNGPGRENGETGGTDPERQETGADWLRWAKTARAGEKRHRYAKTAKSRKRPQTAEERPRTGDKRTTDGRQVPHGAPGPPLPNPAPWTHNPGRPSGNPSPPLRTAENP